MNAMTQALAAAGVAIPPVSQRLWQQVHDHPGETAISYTRRLKLKDGDVQSRLCDLLARGMVEREQIPRAPSVKVGPKYVWVYNVPAKLKGKPFELLPRMTKAAAERKAIVARKPWTPPPAPAPAPLVKPTTTVDDTTIALRLPKDIVQGIDDYAESLVSTFGFAPTREQTVALLLRKARS